MPRSPQGLMAGIVARLLASTARTLDSQDSDAAIRLGSFKELWNLGLFNGLEGFAEEGSLYVATTLTPGTGVASSPATQTAFAETAGICTIYNSDKLKAIHLLAIEELITAGPTASTAKHTAHSLDDISRNPSMTGTQLPGKNLSDGSPLTDGVAQIFVGAPTIVASGGNRRFLGREVVRTVIPVVNDRYIWRFGTRERATSTFQQATATAIQEVFDEGAVRIPPGSTYVLHEWSPARSAAESAEWVILYAVR